VSIPKAPEVKAPPPVAYEAKGRRDPFREPVTGVEVKGGLTVAEVKLVGILYGRQGPMALVEAPDGLGYILRPGDLLGNGRVLEVGLESVTFSVTERLGQPPTRTVVKLKTD
jgi:Tfp pilus assembly protein PilP